MGRISGAIKHDGKVTMKIVKERALAICRELAKASLIAKWQMGGLVENVKDLKGYDDNDACTEMQNMMFEVGYDHKDSWFRDALRLSRNYSEAGIRALARNGVPQRYIIRRTFNSTPAQIKQFVADVKTGRDRGPWKVQAKKRETQVEHFQAPRDSGIVNITIKGDETREQMEDYAASLASAIKRCGYPVPEVFGAATRRVCR